VHRIAHLYLYLVSLAYHTHVGAADLSQQIERRFGLLPQGQTQGVLSASLLYGFFHIICDSVEPVRGAASIDSLMRSLVIVIMDPVLQSLAGIRERAEHRLLEKLPPDCLPEPLDLTQRHRVLRSATHMLHPLLFQHLLKPTLATPGHELPAVIREDLSRSTPLPGCSLEHFQHRIRILLPEQSPAHQVAGMIVDDPDQVDRIHPL